MTVREALLAERARLADQLAGRELSEAWLAAVRDRWEGELRAPNGPWHTTCPTLVGDLLEAHTDGRRAHGVHYTPPEVVSRTLNPLFLDALRDRVAAAKTGSALREVQAVLANVRVLDPACGAGHFLVSAYRALHGLEQQVLAQLGGAARVSLCQLHGIERDPLAVQAASVALELARLQAAPGLLPETAHLQVANALETDWHAVLPKPDRWTFIVGNPPFAGKKEQSPAQKSDMQRVWGDTPGTGVLDYVTAWIRRTAQLVRGTEATAALVTTSSVVQGEQVGALWRGLRADGPVHLRFAHAPFSWTADATVHVVVLGLGAHPATPPVLYDPEPEPVQHLSPYLLDAPEVLVLPRTRPLRLSWAAGASIARGTSTKRLSELC